MGYDHYAEQFSRTTSLLVSLIKSDSITSDRKNSKTCTLKFHPRCSCADEGAQNFAISICLCIRIQCWTICTCIYDLASYLKLWDLNTFTAEIICICRSVFYYARYISTHTTDCSCSNSTLWRGAFFCSAFSKRADAQEVASAWLEFFGRRDYSA